MWNVTFFNFANLRKVGGKLDNWSIVVFVCQMMETLVDGMNHRDNGYSPSGTEAVAMTEEWMTADPHALEDNQSDQVCK